MFLSLVLLVAGCSPQANTRDGPTDNRALAPAGSQKVLTFGLQRESPSFGDFVAGTGGDVAPDLAHNRLVVRTHEGLFLPQLAAEQLSVDRGTWQILADGRMETIWRLRSNARWHDGAPFTASDLLFTFGAYRDPELPSSVASQMRRMESAEAPGPFSFVIRWSEPDVRADQAVGLNPLPRHLLDDAYRYDKQTLPNSPYLSSEFVGLGPYRLVRWDSGVQMEFARFDDYYLGRPPLDRVILRYVRDPNALIANLLAGAVDVVIPPGIDAEAALDVKQRWEDSGGRVMMRVGGTVNRIEYQLRPDLARPPNGLPVRDVREALYRAIDRDGLAEIITRGLAPVADSWVSPGHPLRADVESAIPRFPHDPARAEALLARAGWTRGPDGLLTQPSGERFIVEVWGQDRQPDLKEQPIIADQWKAVGVQSEIHTFPAASADDRRFEATRPGARLGSIDETRYYHENQMHSREIASDLNRWAGRNKLGYANAAIDSLLDRLGSTIDPRARVPLHRDLLRVAMDDLSFMPLYWEVFPILARGTVTGPLYPAKSDSTWNIVEWDKV
ncbi:MAG: hypothetical protein HW416_276 [Chloroflexi bacterium]|nr:hypothetical protein [Chloroflexota bacterium]